MNNLKTNIRNNLIKQRNSLSSNTVREYSDSIIKNLAPFIEKAQNIMIFMNMQNEVKISDLIEMYPTKTFFIPKIFPKRQMKINKYRKDELILHKFGYYESSSENFYDEKILDLIIVPGLGFDLEKNRIGFGGGFYDTFLNRLRKDGIDIPFVAICYDFQIIEKVPVEGHDVKVDFIVTEKGIY